MSAKETVMILGGDVSSTPAIKSLAESGYKVVVVDGNPEAPGFEPAHVCGRFNFREVEEATQLAQKENVKAVIPVHDRAVVPASLITKKLGLLGPSPEAAQIAVNKYKMRETWKRAGLPSPTYFLVNSEEEFIDAIGKIGFPAICKPTADVGGGGRGIRKIDKNADLRETYRFATSFSDSTEALVESYYEGLEHNAEVLMRGGKGAVLMVSDKVKIDPPYRVDKAVVYPTILNGTVLSAIHELAINAAKAVGLEDGAAHVELCTLEDGSNVLFEIGLRCGGGVTPHPIAESVTGRNQFIEYAEILLGRHDRDLTPKFNRGTCWYFITANPGLVEKVSGLAEASKMDGVIASALTLNPGDTIREVKTSSERLGFFVATGENGKEAFERGRNAENRLDFVYAGKQ